ncbi:MAG: hypothetical protein F4213_16625 [Boseongicola sp. SB0677_bin_26]|nr:hypothetical protein [Boseongicola sp. SB0665_bin_10]MYG27617.1 hypothetical protein [Boseongicola sp. SB0677_bin_26]
MSKLQSVTLNQYSIVWLAALLIIGLWTCGEVYVTVPLLIATLVYAVQLILVKWLFVYEIGASWSELERLNKCQEASVADSQFSQKVFSLSCWAAATLFLFFSLITLLLIVVYVGSKVSSNEVQLSFGAFAILVAVLAYHYNTESIPSVTKLKQKFLSPSLRKWNLVIDRAGVAATVLVLIMTLHALGSMLGFEANGPTFSISEMRHILGKITYFHSFAIICGICYVYMTHQVLANVESARMKKEFPTISLGLFMFYGAVQTILILSVHLPVYAHLYTVTGEIEDVPIGEVVSALGPLILSIAGAIVAKLSEVRA